MPRKVFTTLDLNGPLTLTGNGGTNGYLLKTDGSGNLAWISPSGTINATAKTGAYTLTTSDYNTLVQMNAAAAFTLGLNSAPVGTQITLLALVSGVSVTAGSGTTINATPGLKLRAQFSTATAICLSSTGTASTWLLTGDLSA